MIDTDKLNLQEIEFQYLYILTFLFLVHLLL